MQFCKELQLQPPRSRSFYSWNTCLTKFQRCAITKDIPLLYYHYPTTPDSLLYYFSNLLTHIHIHTRDINTIYAYMCNLNNYLIHYIAWLVYYYVLCSRLAKMNNWCIYFGRIGRNKRARYPSSKEGIN